MVTDPHTNKPTDRPITINAAKLSVQCNNNSGGMRSPSTHRTLNKKSLQPLFNILHNNNRISIVLYGRNFRGAGGSAQ